MTDPSRSIRLPWARWWSLPFAAFSLTMAGSFWPDRSDPGVLFWFGVAGVLAYVALSLAFNHTTIRVIGGFLVVRHGPLPWPGRRVATEGVKGVEVTARPSADMTTTTHWQLSAIGLDGRAVSLTWGWVVGHRHDLLAQAGKSLAADLRGAHPATGNERKMRGPGADRR